MSTLIDTLVGTKDARVAEIAQLGQNHEQVLQGHYRLLRPQHLAVPDPRRQHPTHNQRPLKPEESLNGGGYFEGFFLALHTKSQENRPFGQIWCEVPSFRG
ncbi:hypothetical protein CIP107534_01944 [Corynebacterium diphtheriae]|nr:hypothetical protein CIP107534_01944 [Corynebacterium diphtheriae]